MPELVAGAYYDAVLVPKKCGFFRKLKNDGSKGALYLRLQLRCADGQEFPYPYYVSGKMADSLRDDLPKMGVAPQALQTRAFYERAWDFIQPVDCQFGIKAEDYNNETRLKIKGVYFSAQSANSDDVTQLMDVLGKQKSADPFTVTDDDIPWN